MKKLLMTVAAMAAVCTSGGVYDDCVYLFEGGLDANGNGLFSTGELRDELHANPSHANNGAVVSGYADLFISSDKQADIGCQFSCSVRTQQSFHR